MKLVFAILAGVMAPALFSAASLNTGEIIEVRVDGMSCMFCAYSLERSFKKLDVVEDIEINVGDGKAKITVKQGSGLTDENIKEIVKKSGFTPREIKREKDEKQ
jgi:copper chaperone CopZ